MKLFVSYGHRDSIWTISFVTHLQARGFEVWLDELELHPGDSAMEQVRQAMLESDALVSALSGHQPSPYALVEMGMALVQGKPVVPILLNEETDISTLTDFAHLHSIRTHDAAQAAEALASLAAQWPVGSAWLG